MKDRLDALAGYAGYLRNCIEEGNIAPRTLDEWTLMHYGCTWAELGSR